MRPLIACLCILVGGGVAMAEVNAKDHGAIGDGVADDTAAIQAAGSADDSTYADIAGAVATSPINSDDELLIVDVVKPLDRYIRTTLTRGGTTNTTWGGTIAIQYNGRKLPSSHLNLAVAMTTVIGGA